MQKVAVVLSGCGVYDGSEIHEATLSLYALSKYGFHYSCFAPDTNQHHVINHLSGEIMPEKRNVLIESARIARGKIKPLTKLETGEFDAVLFPGGTGAAKNLSNFAFKGEKLDVSEEVSEVLRSFHAASKPIVALCIAPVLVAKTLGATVTIGTDISTAEKIVSMGGKHQNCQYNQVLVDEVNKVISTPCYMLASSVYETGEGIEAAIGELKKLLSKH